MENIETNQDANSHSLTKRHTDVNVGFIALNLLKEENLAQAEIFLKKFMGSDKGGIKSVADGLAILARAQDMQLPFTTCIEHIHVINGKTGVDIHIVKALLSRQE